MVPLFSLMVACPRSVNQAIEQWIAQFFVAIGFYAFLDRGKKTSVELSHYHVQHMWLIYSYNRT